MATASAASNVPGAARARCPARFADEPRRAQVYVGVMIAAGAGAGVWAVAGTSIDTRIVLLSLAWAAVGALVFTPPGSAHTTNASSVIAVASVLLVAPRHAILVALIGQVLCEPLTSREREWFKRAFNVANMTVATAFAGAAVTVVDAYAPIAGGGWQMLAAGVAAAVTYCLANDALLAVVLRLVGGATPRFDFLRARSLAAGLGLALIGVAVAGLWETNPWLLATMAAPVVFGMQSWVVPVLREEARIESKTGLFSAKHFLERLDYEFARATRTSQDVSVLMADVDHFRSVNTQHGHLAGDAVLVGVADILRREVRRGGTASRFGGEEFAVILPETDGEAALRIAERIRAAVEQAVFVSDAADTTLRATISIGVATASPRAGTAVGLLDEADRALYRAKREGRNRVARFDAEHVGAGAGELAAVV